MEDETILNVLRFLGILSVIVLIEGCFACFLQCYLPQHLVTIPAWSWEQFEWGAAGWACVAIALLLSLILFFTYDFGEDEKEICNYWDD